MLLFQAWPDSIFRAILHEALCQVRDVDVVRYRKGYRPSKAERKELDESYRDAYPNLAPLITRRELVRLIDRLLAASRSDQLYRLTDYHWLVLYLCLQTYCDRHNDGITGTEGTVGPYEIDRVDFDAIVERFFFDTDFLLGPVLLQAEENAPGRLGASRQSWKIAAGLKPDAADLELVPVLPDETGETGDTPGPEVPASGYVGPYPLWAREDDKGE
jgi:hypothetical protein